MADYADPDNFLRVFWRARSPGWIGWCNDEYDKLLEKAREVLNQEERLALYRHADMILLEEALIMSLTYGGERLLIKPWVKLHPISAHNSFFWKDVFIEPH